ncbi:DUF167 domain-containing protein [Tianweitania populi]
MLVHAQVSPGGSRNMIEAPIARDDNHMRLRIKVRAVAADNAANEAVCGLMAKWVGLPKSSVSIARGHTSRQKVIAIEGEAGALSDRLVSLAAALAAKPFVMR